MSLGSTGNNFNRTFANGLFNLFKATVISDFSNTVLYPPEGNISFHAWALCTLFSTKSYGVDMLGSLCKEFSPTIEGSLPIVELYSVKPNLLVPFF